MNTYSPASPQGSTLTINAGTSITSIEALGNELIIRLSDGTASRMQLPIAQGTSLTTDELSKTFATHAEVDRRLADLGLDTTPFKTSGRYYSPVTYYWPDFYRGKDSQWSKILRFGENLGIVILNRYSGEWSTYDQDFHTQGRLAKEAGVKRTIFYVKTQYGAAGNPSQWGTDVPDSGKYTKDYILSQLDYCQKYYPEIFQGVFLDEFINGWANQAERVHWYRELIDSIRARYGSDFLIVGNCGTSCTTAVLELDVDVFMSFETTAEKYLNEDPNWPIHPDHMAQYSGSRFWHVIHDVTAENYEQVFEKAERLGIGHLYITDGRLEMDDRGQWEPAVNPYEVAPSQWIANLLMPWLQGMLDTRLLVERVARRLNTVETSGNSQLRVYTGGTFDLGYAADGQMVGVLAHSAGSIAGQNVKPGEVWVFIADAGSWMPFKPDTGLPAAHLSTLNVDNISESAATVSWNTIPGANFYEGRVNGAEIKQVETPWTISGLASASSQTVEVRSVSDSGASPWAITSFRTLSLQVTSLELATNATDGSISLFTGAGTNDSATGTNVVRGKTAFTRKTLAGEGYAEVTFGQSTTRYGVGLNGGGVSTGLGTIGVIIEIDGKIRLTGGDYAGGVDSKSTLSAGNRLRIGRTIDSLYVEQLQGNSWVRLGEQPVTAPLTPTRLGIFGGTSAYWTVSDVAGAGWGV